MKVFNTHEQYISFTHVVNDEQPTHLPQSQEHKSSFLNQDIKLARVQAAFAKPDLSRMKNQKHNLYLVVRTFQLLITLPTLTYC